jgi:hypothetical protein
MTSTLTHPKENPVPDPDPKVIAWAMIVTAAERVEHMSTDEAVRRAYPDVTGPALVALSERVNALIDGAVLTAVFPTEDVDVTHG